MKRITIERPETVPDTPLYLDTLSKNRPIFAKRDGCIKGMIVEEDKGWILRTGGSNRYCQPWLCRSELLHHLEHQGGFTLHVEEEN